jgi:tetratricopeptide (TPR) repeat protein
VESLNGQLQRKPTGLPIEVHAGRQMVDTDTGLASAHKRAREIGERLNAKLVIWGRRGREKNFYPYITMTGAPEGWGSQSERTLQNIDEVKLPEELVDQPFYLIHFAAGYSYYVQNNYKEALPQFEAALNRKGASPNELADLQFSTAFCAQSLGEGQKDITAKLQEAIGLYEKAARVYGNAAQEKWATTQNNLGIAYGDLPTGDRAANLQKAIAGYEAALRVRTEKDFPTAWAATQNNLGIAYGNLPTGDRAINLQREIAAYEAALRVYTEKDSPTDWATTQNNLGIAYRNLPTGDRAINLQKAKPCFEASLRVFTDSSFPEYHRIAAMGLAFVDKELRSLTSE